MICPNDKMQMHQKARIGDGEDTPTAYSTWDLKECPLCGRQVVEFYAAVVVTDSEQARIVGGMLVAEAAKVAV